MAIKARHPATGDSPTHETNEAHVFRAKKCISDVLFELEEKDELEKGNSTSFARNSTQRAFSRADYPSSHSSGLNYSDTSYASASNITPPGCNPYFYGRYTYVKVKKGRFSGYPYYVQCICSCKLHD